MRAFAFLRGINVGGRRPKKDELVAAVVGPELEDVSTFLASGNLAFETGTEAADLETIIEQRLEISLGYDVACFVRDLDQLAGLVDELLEPGPDEKHQIVFFREDPGDEVRAAFDEAAGDHDTLRWRERELVWTHVGGMSASPLFGALPKLKVPVNTVRTANTAARLVAKFR